jgi:hypothetical protein
MTYCNVCIETNPVIMLIPIKELFVIPPLSIPRLLCFLGTLISVSKVSQWLEVPQLEEGHVVTLP